MSDTQQKIGSLPEVEAAWNYPLFDAMFNRRSRRFGAGMEIDAGPNQFKSKLDPQPLSELEEAMLVAAATGITGTNLADMPYPGLNCNTMMQFTGRTYASPCANHGTELFFTNDSGCYMVKLRDVQPENMREYAKLDDREKILYMYRENRVKLSDERLDMPRMVPAIFSFNLYNVNQPGSTLFMPVTDLSLEYINLLLLMTDEPYCMNFVDDLNDHCNMGTDEFVKSGYLKEELVYTMTGIERSITAQIAGAEEAFMGQNIMLAEQAMGLGGWLFGGFTGMIAMGGTPFAKGLEFRHTFGKGKNPTPVPVGRDGLMEALVPPYVKDMDEAVDKVVDLKFGKKGLFAAGGGANPHADRKHFEDGTPRIGERAIAATKAICNYIWETYGRFPATAEPMQMLMWIQSHHIDMEFYDTYYKDGAYTDTQRRHQELWHNGCDH